MKNEIQKYSFGKKIGFGVLGFIINGVITGLLTTFFIFLDMLLDDYIFMYDCSTENISIIHFIINIFVFLGVFYLFYRIKGIKFLNKNKYLKIGFNVGFLLILISLYIGGVFLFEAIDFCECGCS